MSFLEFIEYIEKIFWWLLVKSQISEESFRNILNFVDRGYIRFIDFFETTYLYQFLCLTTVDNGSVIGNYIKANNGRISYPVLLELYGEQLGFAFNFLEANEIKSKWNIEDLKTAEPGLFKRLLKSLKPQHRASWSMSEDWYGDFMLRKIYYQIVTDSPMLQVDLITNNVSRTNPIYLFVSMLLDRVFYPFKINYGLDYDMEIKTFNYYQLYYQDYYESIRYHQLGKRFGENYPEFRQPKESLIELYENFYFEDYIKKNIKNKTSPEDLVLYRSDKLSRGFEPYATGEKYGVYSDYVRAVWDYINEVDEYMDHFACYRWNYINLAWWEKDWWLYGPYEDWIELMLREFIWPTYKIFYLYEDILGEELEEFDFGEKTQIFERFQELGFYERWAMLYGSMTRDWFVYNVFNKYEVIGASTLLSGDLNLNEAEPHLEYERVYNYIMSKWDNTEVRIYSQKYKDYMLDRKQTTYDLYGVLKNLDEQHLLNELPIKTDHLIYLMNIYQKSDKFYAIILDWHILYYRITHLQDTLLYFYSYYCPWLNTYPYSKLKPIFDRICYIIWLYISTPVDYLHWKYADEVYAWFFLGFIFSMGYCFNSLVKILLPHNFLYLLRGQRFKIKNKNKKKKENDIRNKITNYSIEDIDNYKNFLTEFFSNINNLESWIFNIDITKEKKNKIFNFLRLDKNSKKAYFEILKKNKNIMYKKLEINEQINFFKNTNKVRYYGEHIKLVAARSKWSIVRLFLTFLVNLWTEVHYERVRIDADEIYSTSRKWKPRILWTNGFSKLVIMWWGKPVSFKAPVYSVYTLILALLKLFAYWMVYFVYIFIIWKFTNPDLNKFHTKREDNQENFYFKGIDNINKWLNIVDIKLKDVEKKIYNFTIKGFTQPKAKWLHYWQRDHIEMTLYSLKETPGARLYYYWVLFGRFFLLLFNKEKKLNIVTVGWKSYTLKFNYLRLKNYVAFLYWEYLIYRGEIKALNSFGFKFWLIVEFFFGLLLVLLFTFITLGWFWIIWWFLIYLKEKYLKYTVKNVLLVHETKKSVRLLFKISTFFFEFWYILYKNPKTNEGLIISFYIKILYPLINKLYWGYFVSKHQFWKGYEEKNIKVGLYKVFYYWGLLLRVFIIDLFIFIYNKFIYLIRWVIIEFKIARLIIRIKNIKKSLLKLVNFLKKQDISSMRYLLLNYLVSCFDYEIPPI